MKHLFETIILILCIGGAITYIVKTLFLNNKSGCATGCNKCSTNCSTKPKEFNTQKIIKIHPAK